jgi:hypothetical protein
MPDAGAVLNLADNALPYLPFRAPPIRIFWLLP